MKASKPRVSHAVGSEDHARGGFSRIELMVVVAITFLVGAVAILPHFARAHSKSARISCVNNLKQIGTAYRIWANDHGDTFPSCASVTNGGWNEVASRPGNAGPYCWTIYRVISNELALAPAVLICPSDERQPATNFSAVTNNLCLSYFVGAYVSDTYPQNVLGGDRNVSPGSAPLEDFGYSPEDGRGNDVTITGPVCWSLKIHSANSLPGAGNILLGDGSSQQTSGENFWRIWVQPQVDYAAAHPTNSIPVRLIFP